MFIRITEVDNGQAYLNVERIQRFETKRVVYDKVLKQVIDEVPDEDTVLDDDEVFLNTTAFTMIEGETVYSLEPIATVVKNIQKLLPGSVID